MQTRVQAIYGKHDEEVNRGGGDQKRNKIIQKVAVSELAAVYGKGERCKIRQFKNRRDERSHEIFYESIHNGVERCADHNADREIDDIPAKDEILESFHGTIVTYASRQF